MLVPAGALPIFRPAPSPNRTPSRPTRAAFLSFNLNLNLPPPCTTGFLPAQQQRARHGDRLPGPAGRRPVLPGAAGLGPFNVRGARQHAVRDRPGQAGPDGEMCESNEKYVPLNDGFNWKGDPNATLSGQDVPQLGPGDPPRTARVPEQGAPAQPPAAPAPPPPLAVAEYDPATGSYVGPDGKVYTQSDLAQNAPTERTWKDMLIPQTP